MSPKSTEAPQAPPSDPSSPLVTKDVQEWLSEAYTAVRQFLVAVLRLQDTPEHRPLPLPDSINVTVGWPRKRPMEKVTTTAETGAREVTKPILHDVIHNGQVNAGNLSSTARKPFLFVSPLCAGPTEILSVMVHAAVDLLYPPETGQNKNGQKRLITHTKGWKDAAKALGINPKELNKGDYSAPIIAAWAPTAVQTLSKMPADAWASVRQTLQKGPGRAPLKPATCRKEHITLNATENAIHDMTRPIICGLCLAEALKAYNGPPLPEEAAAYVVQAMTDATVKLKSDIADAKKGSAATEAADLTRQLEASIKANEEKTEQPAEEKTKKSRNRKADKAA